MIYLRWAILVFLLAPGQTSLAQYTLEVFPEVSTQPAETKVKRSPQAQDAETFLKSDASVEKSNTTGQSQENALRFRGASLEASEIFFDDIQLTHPYTSYPLNEDLDARAFDQLSLSTDRDDGLMASSLAASGSLHFQLRPIKKTELVLGNDVGDLTGQSAWLRHRYKKPSSNLGFQTFLKFNQTHGAYSYYNNQGTPTNQSDDYFSFRRDNQSRSFQIFPYFTHSIGPWTLSHIYFKAQKIFGVPSRTTIEETSISRQRHTELFYTKAQKSFPTSSFFKSVDLHLGLLKQSSWMSDPYQSLLKLSHSHHDRVLNLQTSAQIDSPKNRLSWALRLEYLSGNYKQSRSNAEISLRKSSTKISPKIVYSINQRWSLLASADLIKNSAKDMRSAKETKDEHYLNQKISLSHQYSTHTTAFLNTLTLKHTKRSPSLLESFGDAAYIDPNQTLRPEINREINALSQLQIKRNTYQWSLSALAFEVLSQDLIFFVPSSFPGSLVARNIDRVKRRGLELSFDFQRGIFIYDSKIFLREVKNQHTNKYLPQQPILTMTSNPSFVFRFSAHKLTAGLLSRYESRFYRDENNRFEMPVFLTHDLHFRMDHRNSLASRVKEVSWGLTINNLTNVTHQSIESPEGTRIEPYAKIDGYAKPGRSVWASLWMKF